MSEARSGGYGFISPHFWPPAAAIWTVCVLALALSPQAESSWLMKTFGDKLLHGLAFAVGALAWVCSLALSPRVSRTAAMSLGAAAALAVGILIEIGQSYVPGRQADVRDLAADLAGIAVALILFALAAPSRSAASIISEPSQTKS